MVEPRRATRLLKQPQSTCARRNETAAVVLQGVANAGPAESGFVSRRRVSPLQAPAILCRVDRFEFNAALYAVHSVSAHFSYRPLPCTTRS